jgi:hypothetical protein
MFNKDYFSNDIFDFIFLLNRNNVKYVIVGGEAVIYYGHSRLTGDIDIYYASDTKNIFNLWRVLLEFWNSDIPGIDSPELLSKKGMVFQFGVPPNRIDLINDIDGVDFAEVWENIVVEEIIIDEGQSIFINLIGIKELIKNKEKSGRYKDKEDLKFLKARLKQLQTDSTDLL